MFRDVGEAGGCPIQNPGQDKNMEERDASEEAGEFRAGTAWNKAL